MTLSMLAPPIHPPSEILRMVRLGVVVSMWLLLVVILERRYALIRRFLEETSSSVNLGVARIAVMLTLLWQVRLSRIERYAGLDHALLVPFLGWGKLAVRLPLGHLAVMGVYACFVLAACCALAGLRARVASAFTAATSIYLLCIPQLTGKVDHDYGHLAIFSFILALAPSGDALSVDAYLRGRQARDPGLWLRPKYARVYATALKTMMVYIGLAYFFPGLWKVVAFGSEWFRPTHLHYAIAAMWDGIGMNPFQRWYLSQPSLLFAGAAVTVVFELGFLLAVLSPRVRPYLILVGIPFHNLTWLLMGIPFVALQACYVIFLDWSPLFTRLADRQSGKPHLRTLGATSASFALQGFCAIALAGMVVTGSLRKMTAWPINCFPTFDWPQPPTLEIRTLQAVDIDGRSHTWTLSFDPVMRAQYGNERWKAMVWCDFGAFPEDPARTRAALRLWLANHPSPQLVSGSVVSSAYLRNDFGGQLKYVSSATLEELAEEDFPQK
jgi:hypothetical protein